MVKIWFSKALLLFTCLLFFSFYSIAQRISYFLHTIKAGETVEQIAADNKTTVSILKKLNNMTAKSVLRVGKNIKIPFVESSAKITTPKTNTATVIDTPVAIPAKHVAVSVPKTKATAPIVAETNTPLAPPAKPVAVSTPTVVSNAIPEETKDNTLQKTAKGIMPETNTAITIDTPVTNTVKHITVPVPTDKENAPTVTITNKALPSPEKPRVISTAIVASSNIQEQTIDYSLHEIKAGETLSGIAKANKTTVGDIMRLNGMNGKSILKIGENVKTPSNSIKPTEPIVATEKVETPAVKAPIKQVVKQQIVIAPPPVVQEVESGTPVHIIKAGETLSGIARANKTTVGDIMRLNGMNGNSILKVGASIKLPGAESKMPIVVAAPTIDENLGIPVKPTTIIKQQEAPTAAIIKETHPIKYTVSKGDNLYRISKTYKITEAQLMQWNGMKNDIVKPGQVLIVGQEATKSPVRIEKKDTFELINSIPPPIKVNHTPHFVSRNTDKVTAVIDSTIVAKPDSAIAINARKAVMQQAIKDSMTAQKSLPKEITVNIEPQPIPKYAKYAQDEGYYAGYFNRKNISKNTMGGDAATFKSKSGWDDKKFYVLINDINQGTIVRITCNNKCVCAQVKGPLPNIKEDIGLLMRINTAAADALGVQDGRFSATVNY